MEPSGREKLTGTSFGAWLSWQELRGHRLVFAINVIIIALLIALPVTFDLMGKAREASVEKRMDYMGPSLSLVPRGVNSYDLVTGRLKGRTMPEDVADTVRFDFPETIKAAEPRLITSLPVEGTGRTAMGMDFRNVQSYPFTQYVLRDNEILLGSVAAGKLGRKPGDTAMVGSREFTVADIIPTTGAIEDASVFLNLQVLQELSGMAGRINEVRIFPRSPEDFAGVKEALGTYFTQMDIVDSYRGDVVEKDIGTTLGNYQKAVYAAAFVLIALCIMISTYINLDGRKAEVSTVYTLGMRQGIVFGVLAFRTVWLALLGAVAGHVLGLTAMVVHDAQAPLLALWSWTSFLFIVTATIALGLAVTVPFALYSVYKRDLLAAL